MIRIYTKSGDRGQTSLGDGSRVAKHSLRVACYGTLDEANSAIGLSRLYTHADPDIDAMLERIQNELFDLGADLCLFKKPKTLTQTCDVHPPCYLGDDQVTRLEREIDQLTHQLPALRDFILPGGTPASAHLHLARTIVRRAERMVVELAAQDSIADVVLRYINRLSDHLFMVSRAVDHYGDTQERLYRRPETSME